MTSNIPESSFNNHKRCISQDESTGNDIVMKSTERNKTSTSTLGVINRNALCCKISLVFLMCCITGCLLISVVLFYVNQAEGNALTGPEYSAEKSTSNAKVCCKLSLYM